MGTAGWAAGPQGRGVAGWDPAGRGRLAWSPQEGHGATEKGWGVACRVQEGAGPGWAGTGAAPSAIRGAGRSFGLEMLCN